jgi:electron transfer flavoprotein alpha subunit
VLLVGKNVGDAAKHASGVSGVTKVLTVDNDALENPTAEDMSGILLQMTKQGYSHVLTPASNNGKNFMPRAAALMNCAPLMDVMEVVDDSTFKRPMYAGNAIATVKMGDETKFLLVRPTAFDKAEESGGSGAVEVASVEVAPNTLSSFASKNEVVSERPDLTVAGVVVSGGRGMKSGENFAMLDKLADKLGGAVGASRAAVDAGMVPNDYQIGQTGKVVAPELYIAVGISGAIQHLSGMKDSKKIVAINKDKEAPIFQVADYGLAEDLFKAVPELTEKI